MTTIVVTAAVIERDARFLVTRRQPGVHLAGYWEFPGGKCEAGESHADSLRREVREELGVDATVHEELLTATHEYPERVVELHFFRCTIAGEPAPALGQDMRWATRGELGTLAFPPADIELIRLLTRTGAA
jgi:8-oxo-dGTP diphosphatase